MAIAIMPEERWPYVLKTDRDLPKENQTTFHLKALSRMERAGVMDAYAKNQPAIGQQLTLEKGIAGWDNFINPETKAPIEFEMKDGKPSIKNLEWINPDDWAELADAIQERNKLTEEEVKNSPSPVTS